MVTYLMLDTSLIMGFWEVKCLQTENTKASPEEMECQLPQIQQTVRVRVRNGQTGPLKLWGCIKVQDRTQ